jgi:hypothetical protein
MYNLVHVSETYNTIMCLHALGISVDVHISQLSVKKVVILFFNLKNFEKKKLQKLIYCEYLSVHGVMIDLFLLCSSANIYYFINFV